MANRRRGRETVADMVRSLTLVLLLVALIAGVGVLTRRAPIPQAVDWASVVDSARSQAAFTPLAPRLQPPGWTATSATYDRIDGSSTLRLGFVTDQQEFMGLAQTDRDAGDFVAAATDGFRQVGRVAAGGRTWTHWTEARGEDTLLVSTHESVATVVTSSADLPAVIAFVGILG